MRYYLDNFKRLLNEAEEKNYAPWGIMFFGNDKVLVGDDHETPVELSQELLDRVIKIAKDHGYYGEGSGVKNNSAYNELTKILGKSGAKYKGSWDDLIVSSGFIPQEEKYVYLATIFSNTAQNKRVPRLMRGVKKGDTIFDLLVREMNNHTQKGLNLDYNDLKKFLGEISEHGIDFLKLSELEATQENVQKFIDEGERLTWLKGHPDEQDPKKGWKSYPNKAGQVARRETIIRDKWIIQAGPGVYFIGCGHLKDIKNMEGGGTLIDGSRC